MKAASFRPLACTERGMRFGRGRRLCLMFSFVAGAGAVLVPGAVHTQTFEYVITFDNVVVRGVDTVDTPETAHRELPGLDKESPLAEAGTDRSKGKERIAGPPLGVAGTGTNRSKGGEGAVVGHSPKITMRLPGSLLPSEPGEGTGNPSFVQEGFLVEAFWAGKVGTREGFFKYAHFH